MAIGVTYTQRGLDGVQVAEFADVLTFFDQADHYSFVPLESNPYVTGDPLQTDDVFFGRDGQVDGLEADLQGKHQDNVLVLYGQRRTGKTSLLYALQRKLPTERYVPVLFDAEGVSSPLSLFWGLANAIHDACAATGIVLPEPARQDYETEAPAEFEHSFLRQVRPALGERRLLLMVDEFESLEKAVKDGSLSPAIFPFFRHLMQHQKQMSFIFCGTHLLQELTSEYWAIFFNAALPQHVTFLEPAATLALIQEPVRAHFAYDQLALERLLTLTGGQPYFTQLLCHSLVDLARAQQRGYITRNEVDDVVAHFIQIGNDHLDYIWKESTPTERGLLLALADETTRIGQPEALWASIATYLEQRLPTCGSVDEARASLETRELVRNDGARIGFTMGLIPEWLGAHYTWASLKERNQR